MQSCTDATHVNPRLELQAAVMAVHLIAQIVKELEHPVHSFAYWSDSSTVIQWINSSHRKQQVFVANRVAEILDTTDVSQWKHVSGINNPADIGTRFITIKDLRQSEWLTGPVRLKESGDNWPTEIPLILPPMMTMSARQRSQQQQKKSKLSLNGEDSVTLTVL